jgi:hypothetical protein
MPYYHMRAVLILTVGTQDGRVLQLKARLNRNAQLWRAL